jgi:hypothetical protein
MIHDNKMIITRITKKEKESMHKKNREKDMRILERGQVDDRMIPQCFWSPAQP